MGNADQFARFRNPFLIQFLKRSVSTGLFPLKLRSVQLKVKQRLKRLREFQMVFSLGVAFFLGMATGLPAEQVLKPITAGLALTCLWVTYRCGSQRGRLKRTLHDLKYSKQDDFWQSELEQLHHLAQRGFMRTLWIS